MFVTGEVALALVLLIGAGLMLRSLAALWRVNPGYSPSHAITFTVSMPSTPLTTSAETRAALRQFHDKMLSIPGVEAVSVTLGSRPMIHDSSLPFWIEGRPNPANDNEMPQAMFYLAEASFQQPFSFLPGIFSSFGTILNYTYVTSNIKYVNTNAVPQPGVPQQYVDNTLLNLSKNAANATLYFDNGTWSARVSGAYRSPYLTNVPGQNLNDVEGTKQTINIDFASSWNITEQLQVSLEALNLTNQFQYQYVDSSANRQNYYHQQGRDFLLGARYKF